MAISLNDKDARNRLEQEFSKLNRHQKKDAVLAMVKLASNNDPLSAIAIMGSLQRSAAKAIQQRADSLPYGDPKVRQQALTVAELVFAFTGDVLLTLDPERKFTKVDDRHE